MMEFKMTTDLETELPAEIAFNFDELKTELADRLSYYNGLVVTEDTIKESRADRAKLNKLRDAIDTRRKEVKKQCLAPYTVFESRVKELTALIDAPIHAIDRQLKSYEESRKAEREREIREYYETTVDVAAKDVMPLERIWKKDWLNSTKPISKVKVEITEEAMRVISDLRCLADMGLDEHAAAVRAKYVETLNLNAAMAYFKTLQASAEAIKRNGEHWSDPEPQRAAEQDREPERHEEAPAEHIERIYLLRLEFQLTKQQANELKRFLTDRHINFTKI